MTEHAITSSRIHYRADIDGLRAVAVLSVVIFHAFPGFIKGGFIGVDIFFVISGYLISTIIFENLNKGTFSCIEFYSRRVKRIFPALLLVLLASYVFGWFALLPDEYQQLGKYIAAGSGFTSNIITLQEAGYFDNSAITKPLLHLWSLGVEEQFYIIWPLLLYFAWKRKANVLLITALIAMVSFYLNVSSIEKDAVATFYSPQTRFWELLSGSLLAWLSLRSTPTTQLPSEQNDGSFTNSVRSLGESSTKNKVMSERWVNLLSIMGLSLLIIGFWIINKQRHFPGNWAILPVLGTVCLIASGTHAWFNRRVLSHRVTVWFGLISYPLYLWHWPLLSFARIINSEQPSRSIRISIIVLSILLAWGTYRFVERPIRFNGSKH